MTADIYAKIVKMEKKWLEFNTVMVEDEFDLFSLKMPFW
jgi:hypothetical protein